MFSRRRAATGSGDPGVRPPDPSTLPRPALWPDPPAGQPARAYSKLEEPSAPPVPPGSWGSAWVAVGLLVLAVALVGLAFVLQSPWPAVLGVLIGAVGGVVAWKARLMETVE